jgi:HNH endonuclease
VQPINPRKGDEVACSICGALFYRSPQAIERDRKTCSKACADVAKLKPPVVKNCEYCGKEMRLKPSQGGIRYCSKLCDGLGRTKRPMQRTHNGKAARQDRQGYVMVWEPEHPNKSFHGWQYEHRLVVEGAIGRYLNSDEHVHHINGIKHDNRVENLQMMDGIAHTILSGIEYRDWVKAQLAELERYRARYGPLPEE